MKNINRRKALKQAAYIMGGAISTPIVAGILNGCTATPKLNWRPQFLNDEQARFISRVTDLIIPKTDTPGAVELGVPEFIDEMIAHVYPNRKELFTQGYTNFNNTCKTETGKVFLDLDDVEQSEYLNKVNSTLKAKMEASEEPNFFYTIKEMTITGYFTTEVAMTQILQYKLLPTYYKGCISLDEAGGKTWAT